MLCPNNKQKTKLFQYAGAARFAYNWALGREQENRRQIEYKSAWNHIPVVIADRFFPSSKLCSCCGNIKQDLKLSDRIYKCECGNVIDRDYQAALNLKRYGEMVLENNL